MKLSLALLLILPIPTCSVFGADSFQTAFVELGQRRLGQIPLNQRESHLRTLIAEYPGHASLHFHLGNELGRQQRWPEARLAYAEASSLAPNHPDIHYNLAVALDHLEHFSEARQQYRAARDTALSKGHAFTAESLQTRLHRLEAFRR